MTVSVMCTAEHEAPEAYCEQNDTENSITGHTQVFTVRLAP